MKTKITTILLFCLLAFTSFGQTCTDATVESDIWIGETPLTADLFLDGAVSGVDYTLSPSVLSCDDLGTPVTINISGSDGFSCSAEATLVDNIPPVVVANDIVNVSLDANGQVNITVDMIEENGGSYDNCGPITKSISPNNFDCSDVGQNLVTLTVQDFSGNWNATQTTVIIEDKLKPVPVALNDVQVFLTTTTENPYPHATLTPADINANSYDNCGIVQMTVSPSEFTCEDIGTQTIVFTVYDASGNSDFATVSVEIIGSEVPPNPNIACNDLLLFDAVDLPVTVVPADILEGGPFACDDVFTLVITDANDNVVTDNLINDSYTNQTLTAAITNEATGNTCWSQITIQDLSSACELDVDTDLIWPTSPLDIDFGGVAPFSLNPTYLNTVLGLPLTDVYPTVNPAVTCAAISVNYFDQVIDAQGVPSKIIRTFNVLDLSNNEIYDYVQTINNTSNPNVLICDTLPRSAPVGDCSSGHTLDDDVEWPNDIFISDPRIEPSELVDFSGIDVLDAQPSFYGNNVFGYNTSYQDILVDLSTDMILIDRVWTVQFSIYAWEYTQKLTVDISEFSNIVTINTPLNRPVPEVEVSSGIFTNGQGLAYVDSPTPVSPSLSDFANNGIDLVDLLLARQHILGQIMLNEAQIKAGDISGNGILSTLDLVYIHKILLGESVGNPDWQFYEVNQLPAALNARAKYIAYKLGDVNDNALLPEESNFLLQSSSSFADILLNQGESYIVPFTSDAAINAHGAQISLQYDPSIIEINDVSSSIFDLDVQWYTENGVLNIVVMDEAEAHYLAELSSILDLNITAKENSILHLGLSFNEDRPSFFVDENYDMYQINGVVEGTIGTGTNDPLFASAIKIFPNPVVDYININVDQSIIKGEYNIEIFDNLGRQIISQKNTLNIDLSNYQNGLYTIVVSNDYSFYSDIIIKIK